VYCVVLNEPVRAADITAERIRKNKIKKEGKERGQTKKGARRLFNVTISEI